MPLISTHFKGDPKLEACLISHPAHVVLGASGAHVGKIQAALVILGAGVISPGEIANTFYGPSTANAVLAFKGPPRNIINPNYQTKPDNIVGKMTIAALDREMFALEKTPPSRLVAVTKDGAPHDHSRCPPLQSGEHRGTPINPLGFGRKINIFGDHETDYLGFEDFSTDPRFLEGRPLTFDKPREQGGRGLKEDSASDICMRNSPVNDQTIREIKRIAMPVCRLTYGGSEENIRQFGDKILRLGILMERVDIKEPLQLASGEIRETTFTVFVLTILK